MGRHATRADERAHGRRVGETLAIERRRSGRSAEAVARIANVSTDAVRSLETGRVATPTFLTVARIAGVLNVSLDELHREASRDGDPAIR